MAPREKKDVDADPALDEGSMIDLPSKKTKKCTPTGPYVPAPAVERSTILAVGFAVFLMAYIWPPLILFVTYLVSLLVPYAFRTNDSGAARRRLYQEFRNGDNYPAEWKKTDKDIVVEESYWVNQRGMCLCTSTMVPKHKEVKAVVCYCHGYTDHSSYAKRAEYARFVKQGIAVVTIEYEGHGRSDGALGLVYDWDLLVDDTSSFFKDVTTCKFPGIKVFLMGESMGGACVYHTYQRDPSFYSGVIFIAPMCKLVDDMLPPQWVIDLLYKVVGPKGTRSMLGYLPLAPQKGDLNTLSCKVPWKRERVIRSPTVFGRNPRLVTARELLDVTAHISNNLEDFDAPFLVQHGKDDRVTDPNLSQALYDESKSTDKTIKLYEGMWHAITSGEADKDIDMVINDSISWILERV